MGLRAWLREPITLGASAWDQKMEAFGRASAGLRPRRAEAEQRPPPEAVRRYRAAVPPVVMARWRFLLPLVAMIICALAVVAIGAFILIYFG